MSAVHVPKAVDYLRDILNGLNFAEIGYVERQPRCTGIPRKRGLELGLYSVLAFNREPDTVMACAELRRF